MFNIAAITILALIAIFVIMEIIIMSKLSDFAAAQTKHYTELSNDVATLVTAINVMNANIAALQTSPGTISDEDQATLDSLEKFGADAAAAATKATQSAGSPPKIPTPADVIKDAQVQAKSAP